MNSILRLLIGLLAMTAASLAAWAEADPSARVGRIAVLDGPSLFRTDRQDAGSLASLNWPITSGAILDTERGSRAELWVGSTAYRLAGDSRVEFAVVDDRNVVLHQAAGTLAITIRDRDQADDIEVRTPNGRVQFGAPGRYRVDVGSGRTNVATTSGVAYVYGNDRTVNVDAGRTASMDPNGAVALYSESLHDGFDDWVAERETATRPRVAQRYVSPAMTGYQDLDAYGAWSNAPEYGTVWYPRAVPVGWAPYRYGRWAWVAPWGWTWVDDSPWGFAPFHYGRWVEVRGRWGWVPGAYVARPVYAPALVAWVGNAGWSVSLNIGSGPAVGWFPLAPREVYVPAYRVSPTYVRQVNVTHVTNVTVINQAVEGQRPVRYAHRESPRAVTVVPTSTLRDGAHVRGSAVSGERSVLREAPVTARAPEAGWVAPAVRGRPEGGGNGRRLDAGPATPGGRESRDAPVGSRSTPTESRPLPGGVDRLPAERRPEARPLPQGIDRLPAERRSVDAQSPAGPQPVPAAPAEPPRVRGPQPESPAVDLSGPERRRGEPRPMPGERRGESPVVEAKPAAAPPAVVPGTDGRNRPQDARPPTPVQVERRLDQAPAVEPANRLPPSAVTPERRPDSPMQRSEPRLERPAAPPVEARPQPVPPPPTPVIEPQRNRGPQVEPRAPTVVMPERRLEPQPMPRSEPRFERPAAPAPEVRREVMPGGDRPGGGHRPEVRVERPQPPAPVREMPQVERRQAAPPAPAPNQPREERRENRHDRDDDKRR